VQRKNNNIKIIDLRLFGKTHNEAYLWAYGKQGRSQQNLQADKRE
jgi:hypothetical protein